MTIKTLLLPALFLGAACNVNAVGLIGTEHADFSVSFSDIDSDVIFSDTLPGIALTIHDATLESVDTEARYNIPVSVGSNGGLDVHAGANVSTGDLDVDVTVQSDGFQGTQIDRIKGSIDVDSFAIYGGATAYSIMGNAKPYASFDLGLQQVKIESEDNNDLLWRGTLGVEFEMFDNVVLRPRASMLGTEDGVSQNNAGTMLQFTIGQQFQLGFQADYLWESDFDGYSVGFSGALFF